MNSVDFAEQNKHFFTNNSDWNIFLSGLKSVKYFLDDLGFLSFGRDMTIVRTDAGVAPVYTNHILQSATQTLQSLLICAEYGNIADTHMLLRKYRDDLFFYLYIIVTCDSANLLSIDELSSQERCICSWINNELTNLNIPEVLKEIATSQRCKNAVIKYGLKVEFDKIGSTLNNYTHGNGCAYYNRLYSHYQNSDIKKLSVDMSHMLQYITITFIFLLVLLRPGTIMATDYIDALDTFMAPEKGSQYWVAPFVSHFVEQHKNLLGNPAIDYLREMTSMEI